MGESGRKKSKKKRSASSLSIGSFALRRNEPEEREERALPPRHDEEEGDRPEELPPQLPGNEIEDEPDEESPSPPPPPPPDSDIEEPDDVLPSPTPPPLPEPEDELSQEEESSEDASEDVIESPGNEPVEIEAPEDAPEPPPEPTPEEIPDSDSISEDETAEEDEPVQTEEAPKKPVVSKGETFNMCPICMGIIKHGLSMLVCHCHKVYHVSCGKRLAHCPNCDSEFSDDMVVGKEEEQKEIEVDYESHEVPKLQLTPEDKLELLEERLILGEVSEEVYRELRSKYESERELGEPEGDELFRCPSCGKMVDRDAERCSCGALFSGDVGFLCPECGRVISFDANVCNHCGVRFSESGSFICPSCGRTLERGAAECRCGTKFSDALVEGFNCPECGSFLESDATECGNCGVSFEEDH